jgi:hypothetical protein
VGETAPEFPSRSVRPGAHSDEGGSAGLRRGLNLFGERRELRAGRHAGTDVRRPVSPLAWPCGKPTDGLHSPVRAAHASGSTAHKSASAFGPDSAEVNSGSGSVLPHVRSTDAGTAVAVAATSLLSHCVWNCDSRHEVRVDYVVSGQLG